MNHHNQTEETILEIRLKHLAIKKNTRSLSNIDDGIGVQLPPLQDCSMASSSATKTGSSTTPSLSLGFSCLSTGTSIASPLPFLRIKSDQQNEIDLNMYVSTLNGLSTISTFPFLSHLKVE